MLILLFGSVQASAEKPGVLNLFLSHFFFMLISKRGFSNPAFQTQGSNPTWFLKPEKNPFQTWKGPFLVYFKRARVYKVLFATPSTFSKKSNSPCLFPPPHKTVLHFQTPSSFLHSNISKSRGHLNICTCRHVLRSSLSTNIPFGCEVSFIKYQNSAYKNRFQPISDQFWRKMSSSMIKMATFWFSSSIFYFKSHLYLSSNDLQKNLNHFI